jgi:large subunit ribosomal protein L10
MNRVEKTAVVEELKTTFDQSTGVILMGFDRINVPDITELRDKIRETGSSYKVVKNTLALIAAEETSVSAMAEFFKGSTGLAYTESDPVALAKTLKEFIKAHPGLQVKAGIVEGQVLSPAEISSLAEMASREELMAKVLFLLMAPLTNFATAIQSPIKNLAVVLKQLEEQKQ